jgi:hypothetical protein
MRRVGVGGAVFVDVFGDAHRQGTRGLEVPVQLAVEAGAADDTGKKRSRSTVIAAL